MEWQDSQYADDMQEILDMATGANSVYLPLRVFLQDCEEKGHDVPFVRQFAQLCRMLNPTTRPKDESDHAAPED